MSGKLFPCRELAGTFNVHSAGGSVSPENTTLVDLIGFVPRSIASANEAPADVNGGADVNGAPNKARAPARSAIETRDDAG
jgi:hypothetical protein